MFRATTVKENAKDINTPAEKRQSFIHDQPRKERNFSSNEYRTAFIHYRGFSFERNCVLCGKV